MIFYWCLSTSTKIDPPVLLLHTFLLFCNFETWLPEGKEVRPQKKHQKGASSQRSRLMSKKLMQMTLKQRPREILIPQSHNSDTKYSWDDEDLNWALISAIMDDPEIKQGLFPPPGAKVSTKNGGGKPKTKHQRALCVALFTSHPVYGPAFALIKTAKDKEWWVHKIKNRLKKYVTTVHF